MGLLIHGYSWFGNLFSKKTRIGPKLVEPVSSVAQTMAHDQRWCLITGALTRTLDYWRLIAGRITRVQCYHKRPPIAGRLMCESGHDAEIGEATMNGYLNELPSIHRANGRRPVNPWQNAYYRVAGYGCPRVLFPAPYHLSRLWTTQHLVVMMQSFRYASNRSTERYVLTPERPRAPVDKNTSLSGRVGRPFENERSSQSSH